MSDPYGPSFPPPGFMAPREPGHVRIRQYVRSFAILTAPIATLVVMVGVLAAIMWEGEHPETGKATPAVTTVVSVPVQAHSGPS